MKLRYLIVLLLFGQLLLAQQVVAPYPHIAYAKPISGVTIDGDLSDWPASVRTFPIAGKMWGNDLSSEEDLSANFRVGYSKDDNTLFLAVVIEDDVTIS
ncbi:MAG: hypothetical protein AAF597_14645, partial [Bacteroidota bacterium]